MAHIHWLGWVQSNPPQCPSCNHNQGNCRLYPRPSPLSLWLFFFFFSQLLSEPTVTIRCCLQPHETFQTKVTTTFPRAILIAISAAFLQSFDVQFFTASTTKEPERFSHYLGTMGFKSNLKSIVNCLSECFKGSKRSARAEIPNDDEVLPCRRVTKPEVTVDATTPCLQPWRYQELQHPQRGSVIPRQPTTHRVKTTKPKRQWDSSSVYSDVPGPSFGEDSLPRMRGNNQDLFTREWTGTTGNPYLSASEVEAEDQAFYEQFQSGPYWTKLDKYRVVG